MARELSVRAVWGGAIRVVVTVFIIQGGAAAVAEFQTPLAVTNVTIVPRAGETIENGTILIEHGRVQAVGPNVETPAHARVIDGAGLYAYPGFIDAASHLGVAADGPNADELERLLDVEQDVVQGPRTSMQKANRKGVWPHLTLRDVYKADEGKLDEYRKAGFTTALVSPKAAILGGKGDVLQLGGKPLRTAVLKPEVTQIVSLNPAIGSEAMRGLYPSSAMGVVALIRQTFMDGQWYRQSQANFANHPDRAARPVHDPVLEAVGELLDREQTVLFAADSPDVIHHALDLAVELRQRLAILGGREAWKVADRLARESVPVIVSPQWDEKPELAPKKAVTDWSAEDLKLRRVTFWRAEWEDDFFEPLGVRRDRIRRWEERVRNLKALMEAGVSVAVTGRDLKGPDELLKNLRTAMEHGLTAEQMLTVLTTGPARILGVSEQVGAIGPGKLANVALFTAPLEDKKAKVRYTIIDGQVFEFSVDGESPREPRSSEEPAKEEKTPEAEFPGPQSSEEEPSEKPAEEPGPEKPEPPDRHPWAWETEDDRKPPIDTRGDVLLKRANVITVTDGTHRYTDVLVVDGRIRAIGRDLSAPEGTTVIPLDGYWIIPGIIDPHSHMGGRGGINEGSQSITAEVRLSDVIDHEQLSLQRALAGGVTTIHLMHGSANAIGGQNAVLKLKYNTSPREMLVTSGPRLVKFALGENPTRANSQARGRRFPGTRMGVESVLRQAFNDALDYRKEWQRYAEQTASGGVAALPRRDLRLEALNDILNGLIWVHSHCYRADEMLRLLAVAQDYGFRVATLQHVLEGYRVAPEMYHHGVAGSTFSDWWGYKVEAYNAIPYNAAMMTRAGVVASVNSDSADTVRYLNLEAAKSIRFGGLTADEAIRLCTINPAIQIGLETRIGSIEAGKDGDFAVFDRHPLDTFARCVMTIVEGEVFFAARDFDPRKPAPGPDSAWAPDPPRPLLEIPAGGSDFYAIVGGTVHPVSGPEIVNGTVVIRDGVIAAVGEGTQPPEGAVVVDATGLHVYPGLINAVSELGLVEVDSIAGTVDTNEIARFQAEIQSISAVNPHSEHINVARCEGITTAGVFPRGGVISGRGGVIQLAGWTMPEMLRKEDVGLSFDLPSLPANLSGETRKRRIEEHEKSLAEIQDYMEQARHYSEVKQLGVDGLPTDLRFEAMTPYVRGEKPVYFFANSYKNILEVVRFSETFGLKAVIVGGGEAWKCAETLARKNIPVIVTSVYGYPSGEYDLYDAYYANPAKLEAAGVLFAIASDSSPYARRIVHHAGMAVAHGLSEERAVRAITLDAAQILGIADTHGSLEQGKIADVIITTGHPCQAGTRTVASFIAGRPVELTSLHEESYRKFSERPKPKLPPTGELRGPKPMRLENFK